MMKWRPRLKVLVDYRFGLMNEFILLPIMISKDMLKLTFNQWFNLRKHSKLN